MINELEFFNQITMRICSSRISVRYKGMQRYLKRYILWMESRQVITMSRKTVIFQPLNPICL